MAAPNFANIMEQIAFRNDQWDELEKTTSATTTGYVDIETNTLTDLELDFTGAVVASIEADRDALAAVLDPGNIRAGLDPFFLQVGQAINSTAVDPEEIFLDTYDHMITNSQSVNSRAQTYGTPSAGGGNVGNGQFLRLTEDENSENMEGWFVDVFAATVDDDARQLGISFEEVFRLRGTEIAKDELKRTGTGVDENLRCQSERDSLRFLKNPGFEIVGGTQPTASSEVEPTSIDGWTVTTALSNFLVSVDVLYRTPPGGTTSISLKFVGNDTITQDTVDVNGTRYDPDTPYYFSVPTFRNASATGNIVIAHGSISRTISLATLTSGVWSLVPLLSTPAANYFYENFKQNALSASIQINTLAVGTVYVDALQLFPFQLIAAGARLGRGALGQYMLAISGAIAYVKGDVFTFTDSETGAVNQEYFTHAGYGFLPHNNAGAETIPDK